MATSTISLDAAGFSSALNDLADHVRGEVLAVIRKACIDLYRRIVTRTPVDTGRAKANWQISTTGITAGEIANSINDSESGFTVDINTNTVTIYNNVEYISYLEDGHSRQQAPNGMVAISLSEFEQHFRNALAGMNL